MEVIDTFHTASFSLKMKSCKNFAIVSAIFLLLGVSFAVLAPQFLVQTFIGVCSVFAGLLVSLFFKLHSVEKSFNQPIQEMQRQDARFKTLIENAPFVLLQFQNDGKILYSNVKKKYPDREIPETVFDLLQHESRELLQRLTAVTVDKKIPETTNDIRWLFSSELTRIHSTILAPVIENNTVTSIIAIITDVTDNTQLHDQLLRIQKLEAVSVLAAGIAHDFNNTMSLISLHSERAMRATPIESPVYDSVKKIQKAVMQAAALTRKLLTLSRGDNDEITTVNINEVINEFQHMLCKVIDRDIQFEVKLDDSIPMIESNEILLEQIITNLIVNARDAIRAKKLSAGEKRIMLETKSFSRGGNEPSLVFLTISDTGIGMSEEVQQKIFEPFFTTKGSDRGTGLGLTMVSGIVKKLSGTISVDSTPGVGTTFTIGFPIAHDNSKENNEERQKRAEKTIAIVEDSPDTLSIIAKYLQSSGYSVIPFPSEGALNEWLSSGKNSFDLLITDYYLADSDGKAVIENVRTYKPQLPIILTSGYPLDQLNIQIERYNKLEYIQKPFSARQVVNKVQSFFD